MGHFQPVSLPEASMAIKNLVGGFSHIEKYESQWEGLSHILWKKIQMF